MKNEVLMKYDVEEGHYYYDKPFVYYKDGKLYAEQYEIKEQDVKHVLRAVKEYKRPNITQQQFYHSKVVGDGFNKEIITNSYDYFFIMFTYQAIGGGIILWADIESAWNDELTRRGKHKCPKCGTQTVMYYRPFCPNCDEITETKGAINLFELSYHLAHRSGKDYGDYIDAFQDATLDEYKNDSVVSISLPNKNPHPCLVEMNEKYNFNKHLFWVSW